MSEEILSLEKAVDLSIKKWEFIIENDIIRETNLRELIYAVYPEFKQLHLSSCGLCERMKSICKDCPLFDGGLICCKEYEKYYSAKQSRWRRYWANKLLERLRKIKKNM